MVKVEDRSNKDKINYESAVKAFIKQEGKLNGDLSIQKSLHTFAKDVVNAVKTLFLTQICQNLGCHRLHVFEHKI